MSQDALTVNMGALHGSRQWGSASMGDAKHGLNVTVRLDNEPPRAAESAYIVVGSCTPPSTHVYRTLHPIVNGKSQTYVKGPDIGRIKQARYSIVVDAANAHTPLSCGDFQI